MKGSGRRYLRQRVPLRCSVHLPEAPIRRPKRDLSMLRRVPAYSIFPALSHQGSRSSRYKNWHLSCLPQSAPHLRQMRKAEKTERALRALLRQCKIKTTQPKVHSATAVTGFLQYSYTHAPRVITSDILLNIPQNK